MKKNLNIEERKKLLLDKLEVFKKEKISEFIFTYACSNGKLLTIDTNLSKEVHGILSGEFITAYLWEDSLNLCLGISDNINPNLKGEKILYFLIEETGKISGFEFNGQCLTTFKELEEYANSIFV